MTTKIKELIFFGFFTMVSTTSLANNFSRIETNAVQNSPKANLYGEKLTTDLPDDSLKIEEDIIYEIASVDPSFPGGSEAMVRWIQSNVVYPDSALANNEQGIVYVKFVVNKDGSISNIQVRKGVSDALDQEAVRVISLMPKWIPGKLKGEFVRTYFTIPIAFRLSEPSQKKSSR